jgi:hypothetical protein
LSLTRVPLSATAVRHRWGGIALALLVTVSAAVHSVLAVLHETPRMFPDEYIYTALGRSIAHGHLEIRGGPAHFPEILQPVLAAPLWGLLSTATAYHGVQVENAVIGSLVALPVYWLARWLGLKRGYALFSAAYALLIPSFTLAAFTVADLLAYTLALAAVAAGVRAVDSPTAARQVIFLVAATLATLARLEYAVLVVAYVVCAVVVERRRALRLHRVAALALLPAAAVFAIGVVGFYHHVFSTVHLNGSFLRWFLVQMLLLTLVSGVVIVPGAVVAALRPHGRREIVYMSFAGALTVLLLAESSVYASSAGDFKERYLVAVLPLVAVAFGAYLRDRRPSLRLLVLALSAAIIVAFAEIPISGYTAAAASKESDSEFLFAVSYVEGRLGVGAGSLVVALVASVGAAAAVAVALGFGKRPALAATLAYLAVASGFAVHLNLQAAHGLRAQLPVDLTWVDNATTETVTAISTGPAPSTGLEEFLFWNASIQREVVLPGAAATDPLNAPPLRTGGLGQLVGVTGPFLYDGSTTTALFTQARLIARWSSYSLWAPAGSPRFRALVRPRYPDGFLTPTGTIQAWPLTAGSAVRVSFTLSLPRSAGASIGLFVGSWHVVVTPGGHVAVACRSGSGPLVLRYATSKGAVNRLLGFTSVRLTGLAISDVRGSGRTSCTAK